MLHPYIHLWTDLCLPIYLRRRSRRTEPINPSSELAVSGTTVKLAVGFPPLVKPKMLPAVLVPLVKDSV